MDSFDTVFSLRPSLPVDNQAPVKRLETDLPDYPVDNDKVGGTEPFCVIA